MAAAQFVLLRSLSDRNKRLTAGWAVAAVVLVSLAPAAGAAAAEPAKPTAAAAADVPKAAPPPKASPSPAAPQGDVQHLRLVIGRELRDRPPPLSLLDIPPVDDGIAGAKLAITDNNTTGKFMKQDFTLDVVDNAKPEALLKDVVAKVDAGAGFVLLDAAAETIIKIADALKGKPAIILNYAAPDDNLREIDCRANLIHSAPTRSMITDALAQYLAWKQWRQWFVVLGPTTEDRRYAEAMRRSAKRFGAKIVEERTFAYDPGNRRSDGGFEQIQQQIPSFTQNAKPHDVTIVADEGGLFGEYLPYRTWDARPVAGTAGLVATSWHPAIELWGGTQFQNRFRRQAKRAMSSLDYNAWMAVRMVGEAATRSRSSDTATIAKYLKSPEFEFAAFKGVKLTLRKWNGQVRQPILVTQPKLLVSVSPQPGFLHQLTELDTLGFDEPETKCTAYQAQ